MQTRTVEQVESWNARPFSGSFRELHDLADDEFSGAVVADDTWAFFLNGRVVGVFQGDIDDFEDTSGEIYTAPDPALPLLFSMQERGGTTQAKYFTEDTAVESADETLRDANFTGFLELSENVLSGDYYVAYYGGRSMSAAFIGQNERLVTGDEAFERANDEVGVFEVRKVSMTITEIPSPTESESSGVAGGISDEASADSDAGTPASSNAAATGPGDKAPGAAAEAGEETSDEAADEEHEESDPITFEQAEPDRAADDESSRTATDAPAGETDVEDRPSADDELHSVDAEPSSAEDEPRSADNETRSADDEPRDGASGSADRSEQPDEGSGTTPEQEPGVESADAADDGTPDERTEHERAVAEWAQRDQDEQTDSTDQDLFREEAQWRETNTIPALDPDESEPRNEGSETADRRVADSSAGESSPASRDDSEQQAGSSDPTGTRNSRDESGLGRKRSSTSNTDDRTKSGSSSSGSTQGGADADIAKLKRAVAQRNERIESLESNLATAKSERDELRTTVRDLKSERDELERRLSDLEAELDAATASSGDDTEVANDVSPSEALAGTNLFVRYESKGQPTLDAIDDGSVDHTEIIENLRLDHHTQFDGSNATVDGEAFESFLTDSARFRFVRWLVEDLPAELVESGAKAALQDVYDAIPGFDRVEFDGTVEIEDEGESTRHQFEVVVRNRMGEPLVVADTETSRQAVRGDEMDDLISRATAVATGADSLAGAFYVTASFFEPDALERAQEAADAGGFFSRSDRESYVKTARKQGYHLCLIEDRSDTFHLTVPEI